MTDSIFRKAFIYLKKNLTNENSVGKFGMIEQLVDQDKKAKGLQKFGLNKNHPAGITQTPEETEKNSDLKSVDHQNPFLDKLIELYEIKRQTKYNKFVLPILFQMKKKHAQIEKENCYGQLMSFIYSNVNEIDTIGEKTNDRFLLVGTEDIEFNALKRSVDRMVFLLDKS